MDTKSFEDLIYEATKDAPLVFTLPELIKLCAVVYARGVADGSKGVSLWGRGLMTQIVTLRYCPLGDYIGYTIGYWYAQ
jgi:hypothetical protein